ncbi:winged helix DNA-binding protein [Blastomonas sp.]|uniref:winged helix DNA-binding protein n=1 Tax=Blastomonas sp. TaxID=1909299 RepID=UPI003593B7C9
MKHFDYNAGPGTGANRLPDHGNGAFVPDTAAASPEPLSEIPVVMREQQINRLRSETFADLKLRNALWDMLLELLVADTSGQQLSMSDLCARSEAPESTALRLIHQLREKSYVNLAPDRSDRRRTYVALTLKGKACFGVFISDYRLMANQ